MSEGIKMKSMDSSNSLNLEDSNQVPISTNISSRFNSLPERREKRGKKWKINARDRRYLGKRGVNIAGMTKEEENVRSLVHYTNSVQVHLMEKLHEHTSRANEEVEWGRLVQVKEPPMAEIAPPRSSFRRRSLRLRSVYATPWCDSPLWHCIMCNIPQFRESSFCAWLSWCFISSSFFSVCKDSIINLNVRLGLWICYRFLLPILISHWDWKILQRITNQCFFYYFFFFLPFSRSF